MHASVCPGKEHVMDDADGCGGGRNIGRNCVASLALHDGHPMLHALGKGIVWPLLGNNSIDEVESVLSTLHGRHLVFLQAQAEHSCNFLPPWGSL